MSKTIKFDFYNAMYAAIAVCAVGVFVFMAWPIPGNPARSVNLAAVPPTFVPVKDMAGHHMTLTMPVSVVGYGHDLLIADYGQIYRYDRSRGIVLKMQPVLEGRDGLQAPTINGHQWVPTGLTYDAQDNLLYVANYLANNILVLRADREANQLYLVSVIASPQTEGPENVALSPDRQWLVSANYDGSSVTAFHRKDQSHWEQIWSRPVKWAHGVAITKDAVFATSLGERALVEISLEEGTERRRIGSIGRDGRAPQFLWPTQVATLGNDRIAIADPHTGRISILKISSLAVEHYFGANGPGWNFLNMPYAVHSHGGKLLIISTYQSRLLELDPITLAVTNNIVFGDSRWNEPSQDILRESASPLNAKGAWENYLNKESPGIKLGGSDYLLAYRHLHPLQPASAPLVAAGDGLFNPVGDFYFLQAVTVNNSVILWSPQMPGGVVYTEGDLLYGGPVCETSSRITVDTWAIGTKVFSPYVEIDYSDIADRHDGYIKKLQAGRRSDGILARDVLFRVLLAQCYGEKTFETRFRQTFVSESGKDFLNAYDRWESGNASGDEVRQAASDYFEHASKLTQISLSEFSLIQMLSGIGARLNRMTAR